MFGQNARRCVCVFVFGWFGPIFGSAVQIVINTKHPVAYIDIEHNAKNITESECGGDWVVVVVRVCDWVKTVCVCVCVCVGWGGVSRCVECAGAAFRPRKRF